MVASASEARANAVLAGLDSSDLERLLPDLELVELSLGSVLHQPDERIVTVYFPLVGVISVVVELEGGEIVEAATIGPEGVAGISLFLGSTNPPERTLVQVAGQALAMPADRFCAEVALPNRTLDLMLRRSAQAVMAQLARNAACSRVHQVHQRAARWLLMTRDRMGSDRFELTQEFLAQMLAVRRASVSAVAQALAEDGCITYTRGVIDVLDVNQLRANACDCYDVIRRATEHALAGV